MGSPLCSGAMDARSPLPSGVIEAADTEPDAASTVLSLNDRARGAAVSALEPIPTAVAIADRPLAEAPLEPEATGPDPCALFETRGFHDRYVANEVLGRGGMGEVRLCRDVTIGRDVALKVVRPRSGSPTLVQKRRFVREARVQGQLEHPAIVPVYDAGLAPDGALYFTMKRVRGESLSSVLRALREADPAVAQRFSQRRLLTLFSQISMAVHFGHEKGVVHRDLKPDNLMLGDFGEVYVLDWGLATLRREADAGPDDVDDGGLGATLSAGTLGTPRYMAPEQIEHGVTPDARCDVYALGAILFELLTLERLHPQSAMDDVLLSTLTTDGARASERTPDRAVPPELDRLCHAATRLAPADRIASAKALAQAVDAYLDGDRDLALRRGLAEAHADAARAAFSRAREGGASEPEERTRAMREVTAALALDPEHRGARETLVRLIAEPPKVMPPEAAAEIDENRRVAYVFALRMALRFYLSYLLYLPLLLWMGVRSVGLFAFGWICIATCAMATYLLLRKPVVRPRLPIVHLVVSSLTVGAVTVLFGPFVLVPMLAIGNSVVYLSCVDDRRSLVPLAACLAVLLPALLGWMGVIPDPYVFDADRWIIRSPVFHTATLSTQVFLLCASLGTIAPACWVVARLRRAYSDAEQRLQLQAWQLRQILPG